MMTTQTNAALWLNIVVILLSESSCDDWLLFTCWLGRNLKRLAADGRCLPHTGVTVTGDS